MSRVLNFSLSRFLFFCMSRVLIVSMSSVFTFTMPGVFHLSMSSEFVLVCVMCGSRAASSPLKRLAWLASLAGGAPDEKPWKP